MDIVSDTCFCGNLCKEKEKNSSCMHACISPWKAIPFQMPTLLFKSRCYCRWLFMVIRLAKADSNILLFFTFSPLLAHGDHSGIARIHKRKRVYMLTISFVKIYVIEN